MNTNPNKRPIVALATAGVLAWALAGCSGSTNLVTPTLPPDGTTTPTSAQPTIAPPTAPPTQPVPDDERTATTVVNPDPEPEPEPEPDPAPDPDPDPEPNPPRIEPEPGVRYNFTSTPQLGPEPVRGSGCGADGSIGDTIPDGLWFGWISDWEAPSFQFDLVCVYYGDSAVPHRDACYDGSDSNLDVCLNQELSFWVVNNNSRTRPVSISPSVDIYNPGEESCSDPEFRFRTAVSLIQIYDGEAIYVRWACGGS